MKYIELMEGAEPKLPGAPQGIQIMTPQQFVAKSAGGDEPKPENEVTEAGYYNPLDQERREQDYMDYSKRAFKRNELEHELGHEEPSYRKQYKAPPKGMYFYNVPSGQESKAQEVGLFKTKSGKWYSPFQNTRADMFFGKGKFWQPKNESVEEATKLPVQSRPFGDDELTSYLDRIRKQEKTKTDKYKLPYIHRSSVMGYYNEEGKKYNTDAIKKALAERPKALLKKNEKMKHSDGEQEQFFNVGFAALVGIALDEQTNELIIVNTCPGAGSCKIDCFAMKGGKIQFQGPWLSDGRILTYLLNDPDGFFNQLKAEITKEEAKGKKGGYSVSIRWHDAGDFFSPEYAEMAFKLASELPNVDFYAYTKVADVALGNKPDNFMINWSEGAASREEKKVKSADPELEKTKNSRIVPTNLFYDLLVKDEKKNLVKGPEGQWQVIPDKLPELKQRLAKEYGLSANSILSYQEWETKGKKNPQMKWNVIITPGEPDLTAKDPGVLSTLLLKH